MTLLVYALWPQQKLTDGQCLIDTVHELTKESNTRILLDHQYRFMMIVSGQLFIDIALLGLFILFLV